MSLQSLLYITESNIYNHYSLMSEEGQSKPSNLGQTEVQQWNQMSTKHNSSIHHVCQSQYVNLEAAPGRVPL